MPQEAKTMRLYERAVRQRWPISDEMRETVIEEAEAVLKSDEPKFKIQAARVLLLADAQNQSDMHKAVDVEQKELDRAQRQEVLDKQDETVTFDGVVVVEDRGQARKVMNWSEVEESPEGETDMEDHSQFFSDD